MHPHFDLLCCPACRGDLAAIGEDLHCPACRFTFPVVEGIPVLFPMDVKANMEALFGRYWDAPEKAALYDAKVEGEGERDLFGTHNHLSEMAALTAYFDPGRLEVVLDAGCGNGRFLSALPETTLKVGADASLNLLRIVKKKGRGDLLVCCELEHLPFKSGVFSTVLSCRVLQHLRKQEQAVAEMARVCGGMLILELYNTWNLKTLYKEVCMSRLRHVLNAPFRLIFRSMSPFDHWGLDFDDYNGWFEVKRWVERHGLTVTAGRGVGFGFHKYLFQPFYIDAVLSKRAPGWLERHYAGCRRLEGRIGPWPFFRWTMEKFVLVGERDAQVLGVAGKVTKTLRHHFYASRLMNREAWAETASERGGYPVGSHDDHLRAALDWLKRAQLDHGGVSRGYSVGYSLPFGGKGWQPAYPETTGYLIPTFLACAKRLNDPNLRARALAMADWELDVQMANGAVMGGTVDTPPTPAVFNTGQVILGLLAAYEESHHQPYLQGATRAGEWLLSVQRQDGGFCRGNSRFALKTTTTYNARVGWALLQLARVSADLRFKKAGEANMAFTLARQEENGWFADNCLSDPQRPLLHTICYAVEGLLGGYAETGDEALLSAARLTVGRLVERVDIRGFIPGRLDAHWKGAVSWSCLTGSAQLAGLCFALGRSGSPYHSAGERLLTFIKGTQNRNARDPGLRGGIKGSFPFDGAYGRFELLNWAAKFFIDALLADVKYT